MKKIQFNPYQYFTIILFVFIIINWLILSKLTTLAPPDYYRYFISSEKILSFDFSNFIVPPLFPLLLGAAGNFFSLFHVNTDPFIFGGQFISLLASLGTIYFLIKIFRNLIEGFAPVVVASVTIFPFFLKFFSLPLTDILFVFFVIASFSYFLDSKLTNAFFPIFLGIFTRFEGVLLLFSMILLSLKSSARKIKMIFFLIAAFLGGLLTFFISSKRLLKKIDFVVSHKSYLYFLLNPAKFGSLLYVNFFFFLPDTVPLLLKVILTFMFVGVVIYGYIFIYRINKRFTISLIIYKVLFIIGKGYLAGVGNIFDPMGQTRRMLSVIFLFWLVFILGSLELTKKLKQIFHNRVISTFKVLSLFSVLVITILNLSLIKKLPLILLVYIFCAILFFLGENKVKKRSLNYVIILLLFLSMYSIAFNDSRKFIGSLPNRGAFMIANWANASLNNNDRFVCYSDRNIIDYYTNSKFKLFRPFILKEDIYRDSTTLRKNLVRMMKRKNIRFIAFELYMNKIDSPGEVRIKKCLYRTRKNQGLLKLKKYLFYKGKIVAMVMKKVN